MSFDTNPNDDEPIDREEYEKYEKQGIFDEIVRERMTQDLKWGGQDHDDEHDLSEWREYIQEHNHKSVRDFRKQMIRVAALACAAIESFDRKAKRKLSI